MAVFENRSGAYFMYVSSGSAENRHLQAAMATFGSGSKRQAAPASAVTTNGKSGSRQKRRVCPSPAQPVSFVTKGGESGSY